MSNISTIPMSEYAQRRKALMAVVPNDSLLLIPAAREILRNGVDNLFYFRQNSDFLYLTGFHEPDAVLVLAPGRAEGEVILFNRERNPEQETWTGKRAGQQGACQDFQMDQAFKIEQFTELLPELMIGRYAVYYPIGRDVTFDEQVRSAFGVIQSKVRRGVSAPAALLNIEEPLHQQRLTKSAAELAVMQTANTISKQAHTLAMQRCQPGMYEYQLEAIFQEQCYSHGCRGMAYSPIVGSGANSCVLHYHENNKQIESGDLVLIDAGVEYNGYASDITRTFPANGRFSPEQKIIYNIVLDAQLAVFDIIKPGLPWQQLQNTAAKTITKGLVAAGLLEGEVESLYQEQAYKPFYMHLIGHWLGLDVHDAGVYAKHGEWQTLKPNMVFTVEPGIYIPANTPGVDSRWWNIGVRIEDNVIVTETGMRNLTDGLPKTVAEIEAVMQDGK